VGVEWCDAGVLRVLRARSLARLRREVEPVDQAALVRFTLDRHGIGAASSGPDTRATLLDAISRLQGAPIPASHLERDVLRLRLPGYDPRDLDLLLASGEVVWTGDGRLGPHDGRVRLLAAVDAPLLAERLAPTGTDNTGLTGLKAAVFEHLRASGASFFPAIARGAQGLPSEALNSLWDLVWMGLVTNDTLQPLRSLTNPASARRAEVYARRRAGKFRPLPSANTLGGRPLPPSAGGRWSLVQGTLAEEAGPTDRLMAWCEQLLDRYGVLTREAIAAEGIEGGFSSLYPVLGALEDAGRVRRGYFVEGLGATQFAVPEAVEKLRSFRRSAGDPPLSGSEPLLIAATDPACLFGASIAWPSHDDDRRPARAAGAYVAILHGEAAAWLSAAEKRMVTFSSDRESLGAAVEAIRRALASGRLDPFVLARIDGQPAGEHPASGVFHDHGFAVSSKGVVLRRPAPRSTTGA
jgi:ATP-dependent Lhr-like helicase